MKTRSIISIIGTALALMILFAGMPVQALADSVDEFSFDQLYSTGEMGFSWETVTAGDEIGVQLQVKGGGITTVWSSLYISSVSYSGDNTVIITSALTSDPASLSGKTISFRLRVVVCTEQTESGCNSKYNTGWAYVDVTFD